MSKQSDKKPTLLTRSQWTGVLTLAVMLAAIIGGVWAVNRYYDRPTASEKAMVSASSAAETLEESLAEKHRKTYYKSAKADTVPLWLHPFDPNSADSVEFLQLGFRPWMAHNVMKYRSKGGVFRTKQALRKIYGMTDELYQQIEPYATIVLVQDTALTETRALYPQKKDTILELNTCDTAQLQLIRGIGRYTALQIVRYRQQLGGYVSPLQLKEIKELDGRADSLLSSFVADPALVRPLPVNHTTVEKLQRHPYLSFTQAKELYDLRRRNFRLKSIDEIGDLECFSQEDIERLKPYLSFEE